MSDFPIKTLNQISFFVNKFSSVYIVPQRRSGSFPGHSPRPSTHVRPPRQSAKSVVFSAPRPEPTLDQLAHQATRPDFAVYPDLRHLGCSRTMFGRSRHEFLYRQKVNTPSQDADNLACLKELNRLARVVEVTQSRCPIVPIYFDTPRLSQKMSSDRVSHMVAAELLGFTKNGFVVDDFGAVFPQTERPSVSWFSGQPRTNKDKFNELLSSKLSSLRSKLGLTSTPSGAPALVSSWINRLLGHKTLKKAKAPKPKPSVSQENKSMTSASEKKVRKNKVDFVQPSALAIPAIDEFKQSPSPSEPSLTTSCPCGISKVLCFVHADNVPSPSDSLLTLRDLRKPLKLVSFLGTVTVPGDHPTLSSLNPIIQCGIKAISVYFGLDCTARIAPPQWIESQSCFLQPLESENFIVPNLYDASVVLTNLRSATQLATEF